jgi:hypothetical protein
MFKNNWILWSFSALHLALLATQAQAQEELTGDVKFACEALLCLSSGTRPSECSPSLNRYFSIKKKKWSDTVEARLDFLRLCPASDSDDQMSSLTNAIAHGAGRCDADYLNSSLRRMVTVYECTSYDRGQRKYRTTRSEANPDGEDCQTREIAVIDNTLPSYCVVYQGHGYTYQIDVEYVGDTMDGGRWVKKN